MTLFERQSERAVVHGAFVNGVSTRKIERLAHATGIENIAASQVSEFNKVLDAQVVDFKARPLAEGRFHFFEDGDNMLGGKVFLAPCPSPFS